MKFSGELVGFGPDTVTFRVMETADFSSLLGRPLDINVNVHREKRSIDQNAYFHVLVDRLRNALHPMTFAAVKNMLICSYGQVEYMDGEPVFYVTQAPPDFVANIPEPHLALRTTRMEDNSLVYTYQIYRGSHTYNTAEMAQLIDGTQQELKELGLEYETPDQIRRMEAVWGVHYTTSPVTT